MPPVTVILAAGLAVAVGALVQSGAGLGVGLVASPVVALLDPALMPGSMLVTGTWLPALILAREARHTDWRGVSWALAGRVAGTVVGVWVVAALSFRALEIIVGIVVLAGIAVTSLGTFVPRNRWTLLTAGVISGATATASSIGGPPVALLYQRERGPCVRATLSVFLCVGNLVALAGLAASGHLPTRDIGTGLVFVAFAAIGFAASPRLRQFLDAGRTRIAVPVLACASAIVLIVHSIAG